MKKQKGVTITGMLIVSVILVLALLLVFKVIPVYVEYNTIKKTFQAMGSDPALQKASLNEMRASWEARTSVDNVKSLSGQDIVYAREPGGWAISADYSVKLPLFQNVSLYFDFHPTSN
jgi:hypothetical protein